MKTIRLKKKEERRILRGHPWVFSNELQAPPTGYAPGEIVDVLDFGGTFIGRGYINPRTLIAVRLLTRKQEEIDHDFFRAQYRTGPLLAHHARVRRFLSGGLRRRRRPARPDRGQIRETRSRYSPRPPGSKPSSMRSSPPWSTNMSRKRSCFGMIRPHGNSRG